MVQRIGKGSLKVKRQEKILRGPGYDRGPENCRLVESARKGYALLGRFVILDTDLISDAGMAVPEVFAFSVADYLS